MLKTKHLWLSVLIAIPLAASAFDLQDARLLKQQGLPQLPGTYWRSTRTGPTTFTYRGLSPQKTWYHEPTSDELVDFLSGSLVIARDGNEWTAIDEIRFATGATLKNALTRLTLGR